jgi:hypothetical protein
MISSLARFALALVVASIACSYTLGGWLAIREFLIDVMRRRVD